MDQHNPFECPICNHWYNVANEQRRVRSLGCGHSMCTSCLQRMHQSRSITCPQCKTNHEIESVDTIPINFVMESVITSREKSTSTSASSEGSSVLSGGLCQKHATMKLFYCDTCKMFICVHCTVLEHPRGDSHKIIEIVEALNNKKSINVSDIDSQIKKLKGLQTSSKDRIKMLETTKATNNSLLQRFANVTALIQKTVVDADVQHKVQTQVIQGAQEKINQLSIIKQQVISTETLGELSSAEKDNSTLVTETKKWIKVNEDMKEFTQLQKQSEANVLSGRSALTTFDAANTEDGREGILVLHLTKKDLADQLNIGSIFATSLTYRGTAKKAELKLHNGKLHLPKPVASEINVKKDIVLPYSAVKNASKTLDFLVSCQDKGSCSCD